MRFAAQEPLHIADAAEQDAALAEFFAAVRTAASERRVAEVVISLFAGATTNLQEALHGLDVERAKLVAAIIADYLAARFDFTDDELVREHFHLLG